MGQEAHEAPSEKTKKDEEVRNQHLFVPCIKRPGVTAQWKDDLCLATWRTPSTSDVNHFVTKHLDAHALFSSSFLLVPFPSFHFYNSSYCSLQLLKATAIYLLSHITHPAKNCARRDGAQWVATSWFTSRRSIFVRPLLIYIWYFWGLTLNLSKTLPLTNF